MKRLNKIKRKEYYKLLIETFAIKTMGLIGLVLSILKIVLKPECFLIRLLDSEV
ncbi:hypothetical protein [Borreliella lanei]|uniref:Preprotein translocase subunit Sss1 n=1 Tax=Borreliella lanei TaxID=373540 RepID=A0A7X0DKQ7_9SPIR|nr:hypothetical protein [Borreliella lanei]MBB6208369.1 preprotein translocase subunit Sss1 [Borreliella lanei]WKC85820.1 hypothetical protein QIA23_00295 [Borreliella lanei]